jgi:uncharacterized membrane protein HdeD (DUF308 family)
MSVPTGSDASTDWLRHWRALAVAAVSLAVVGGAAFLQPQTSPNGYVPVFLGFAALAVGCVYLAEETRIRFASSEPVTRAGAVTPARRG